MIISILLFSQSVFSQSLHIFDIDTTDFPTMRAKFWAFDDDGNQMLNLSPSDFELTENGEVRAITNISCTPPSPPKALSSVLVVDISGSMGGGNLDLAKSGAKTWIHALPKGNSECAITSFNSNNYLNMDFTNDKTKLLNAISTLTPGGGTNFNSALLNPLAGGLQISEKSKYKKVIVFLTDGQSGGTKVKEILNLANNQNCSIFCVTLRMPAPQSVKEIAEQTGGIWFENVSSTKEIEQIYLNILSISTGNSPCTIEWESETPCQESIINLEVSLLQNSTKSNSNYIIPKSKYAELTFNPQFYRFQDPTIGLKESRIIKVTARNSRFNVSGILSSNPNYNLEPNSFILNPDESIDLTLSYTAIDSAILFNKFTLVNDNCEQYFYTNGGFQGKKPNLQTLNLTHPNGREVFVIGSDSVITWEGISPTDTVKLEYSTNNGASWKLITNAAFGLKYLWENIPRPASDKCLVRVSQLDYGIEKNNPTPKILWQNTYGSTGSSFSNSIIELKDGSLAIAVYSKLDKGDYNALIIKINQNNGEKIWEKYIGGSNSDIVYSLIESLDGSLIVVGYSDSYNGDIKENKGESDCLILKLNSDDGSIIWEKTFGGSSSDIAYNVTQLPDSTIVIAGSTNSKDGDVNENKGSYDIWTMKLNHSTGALIWEKTYGGSKNDFANSIIISYDGNFVIGGYTYSNEGDFSDINLNLNETNSLVMKLNSKDGTILWYKIFGGEKEDAVNSIIELSDGSIISVGQTKSTDGDVVGSKGLSDVWVVRFDEKNGSILQHETLGGSNHESGNSIIESSDGFLAIAGYSYSNDVDLNENKGFSDSWAVKIDQTDFSLIWQKSFGGSDFDGFQSVIETYDGNFVFAGNTHSYNGDIINKNGKHDAWVVKLAEPTILQSDVSDNVFSIVEPIAQAIDIDMGSLLVSDIKDSVVTGFVSNIGTYPFTVDSIYFQGADANAFSLVSGVPEYNVEPSTSHFGEFRFSPNRVGLHTAEVVVITQSNTLTQSIIGLGVEQNLAILENFIDFGQVNLGEFKDTLQTLTIKNIGTVPFTITETKHTYPNDIDFTTISGGGNFTLQPTDTRPMELRFTPSDVGRTSGMLEFHYDGIGSPAVIQLFGEGIDLSPASLKLETIQLEAYAGQEIEIPILITEQENLLAKGIKTISTELIFNPTLLLPLDYAVEMIDNTTAKIYIDDLQISSETIQTSKTIKCKVGLGNAEECELILGNSVVNEGDADITIVNGNFKLLGICYEGGTRLINPNSNISIKNLSPNPAQNKLEINLSLIEKGRTELSIYNISGEKVNEILNDEVSDTGDKVYNVNISSLPSGNYFVVLITPTYTEKKKFIIQR